MPIWRIYKTSAYKKYLGALDTFREYVNDGFRLILLTDVAKIQLLFIHYNDILL